MKELIDAIVADWPQYSFAGKRISISIRSGPCIITMVDREERLPQIFVNFFNDFIGVYDFDFIDANNPIFENSHLNLAACYMWDVFNLVDHSCQCNFISYLNWHENHWEVSGIELAIHYCASCGSRLPVLSTLNEEVNRFETIGSNI